MSRKILINLPVKDVEKSKIFFETLGLLLNEELTDENATCFSIDTNIILALLPAEHFGDVIQQHEVVDTTKQNEVLLAIGVENRTEVDTMATLAARAGGKELIRPTDYGTIYGATFADPDGHQWNVYHMSTPIKS